jgi:hypothetical protein
MGDVGVKAYSNAKPNGEDSRRLKKSDPLRWDPLGIEPGRPTRSQVGRPRVATPFSWLVSSILHRLEDCISTVVQVGLIQRLTFIPSFYINRALPPV